MSNTAAQQAFASIFGNMIAPAAEAEAPVRKKSRLWVNVGLPVQVPDENGNMTTELLSLPVNIAIDTMKPREELKRIKTKSQKVMNDRIRASNALLEKLQKAAEHMEDGSIIDLPGFVCQMQKLEPEDAPADVGNDADNPFLAQLNAVTQGF